MYATPQLARVVSKPSKAHMAAVKNLVRYLAGSTDIRIVHKRGNFKRTEISDANWGINIDNGKPMPAYMLMMASAPMSFRAGRQTLAVVPTT